MKKITNYLIGLSVLINLYVLLSWIYCFNVADNQQRRLELFAKTIYPFEVSFVPIATLVLTIFSIVLILKSSQKVMYKWLLIVQIAFAFLQIWWLL